MNPSQLNALNSPYLSSSPGSGASNPGLDFARRKQINTLRIFNENVTEVTPDLEYRVDFTLSDGKTEASLHVFLPPGFPFADRPRIAVGPQAAAAALRGQAWLDPGGSGGVVAAPGLVSYSVHSDLGRVVQVIKRELAKTPMGSTAAKQPQQQQPPIKKPGAIKPFLASTGKAHSAHLLKIGETNQRQQPQQQQRVRKQTYVSSLTGLLDDMTDEELIEVASDDAAARDLSRRMVNPTRDRHGQMIQDERKIVEALLVENAELEERISGARSKLEAKAAEAGKVRAEMSATHAAVAESSRSLSPSVMVDRMRISSLQADESSEEVADSFLEGNSGVDSFVRDYVEARSLVHLRKAKLDQFRRIVRTNRS